MGCSQVPYGLLLVAVATAAFQCIPVSAARAQPARFEVRARDLDAHFAAALVTEVAGLDIVTTQSPRRATGTFSASSARALFRAVGVGLGMRGDRRLGIWTWVDATRGLLSLPGRIRGRWAMGEFAAFAQSLDDPLRGLADAAGPGIVGAIPPGEITMFAWHGRRADGVLRVVAAVCGLDLVSRGGGLDVVPGPTGASECPVSEATARPYCHHDRALESLGCIPPADVVLYAVARRGSRMYALLSGRDRGSPDVVQLGESVLLAGARDYQVTAIELEGELGSVELTGPDGDVLRVE